MPLVDPDTGDISSAAFALDTHAATAGDPSIFDSAVNVVTKGIPLAALAVANSFINTGIDVGNWVTSSDNKNVTVQDEVGDGDLNDYYQQHQQGIEDAALIAGSLIPGLGTIKGASVAVKAAYLAKTGLGTEALAGATGFLAPIKAGIIKAAQTEIDGAGGLFADLIAEKTALFATGAADQALQGAVYSAATAATMHGSPLLQNEDFSDVADDIGMGALTGGLIGGVLEGIGTRAFFNKQIVNADQSTKAFELQTRLGLGNYTAGDRAASLIDSLDAIPKDTDSILGNAKRNMTTDAGTLAVKKILSTMVPDGDEDVTNSLFDSIVSAKQSGDLDKEGLFERLGRLDKVSRYTGDDTGTVPTGDTFFLNKYAPEDTPSNWMSIVSNTPDPASQLSLKYALAPGAQEVSIARFADTFTGPGDTGTIPLYTKAADAWENGHDIFIDKNLQVHVNPDAPNLEGRVPREGESRLLTQAEEAAVGPTRETGSLPEGSKPLYGAPLILNTITNDLTTTAVPVVGDFGKPEIIGNSLRFGDQLSNQAAPLDLATASAQDVNARYVYSDLRGVKAGDTIAADDIPAAETLYKQATAPGVDSAAYFAGLDKRGITLADEWGNPQSATDLLGSIQDAKNDLISKLSTPTSSMSTEEIALRANTSESYITSGLKGDATDFMRDTSAYQKPNHIKLEYNVGALSQDDGMILRGSLDTQYRIQLAKQAAQDAVATEFGDGWEQYIVDAKASDADILGVNSQGFISSANADYGTIGQELQRVGKMATNLAVQRNQAWANKMYASVAELRESPEDATQLGLFRHVRLSTHAEYTFLPPELAATYKVSPDTAVLRDSLVRKKGVVTDWKQDYVPEGFIHGKDFGSGDKGFYSYYPLSKTVADFERAQQGVNATRLMSRDSFRMAQGLKPKFQDKLDVLYTPAVDTQNQPFFAYVKNRTGTGLADDGVAVVTARDAQELRQKIAALTDEFSVYTKDQIKDYHQIEGDYEYNRNFAQSSVNTALAKKGILNNLIPDTRADTLVKYYTDWNAKQELSVIRDHIELGNAQLFAELRAMGERFQQAGTSETGFVSNFTRKTVDNPYDSYIKTALGISPKDSKYPLWAWANEKIEATFSTAFQTAKDAFISAKKGLISYDEASQMAQKFGLGNVYENAVGNLQASSAYYGIANKLPEQKYLGQFVRKANSIMGATVIRLDMWQQLIHAVTDPMLMATEAQSVLTHLETAGSSNLGNLLTTELPDGTGRRIPALSKVIFNAVGNYFNPEVKNTWLPIYQKLGIIRDAKILDQHQEMINNLTLPSRNATVVSVEAKLKSASDFAAKWITQSDNTNSLMHFMSADIGRQIFEAAGYQGKQLTDNIGTFQNRVFGNYVASQRPVAFQGPVGQAVGLFQTYYLNLMQQVFRYIENGEGKSLAILGGLQTSLFGMQSLPGFQAINNHLIGNAAGNPNHNDLYSGINNLLDKKLGDFITYGAVSNFTSAGLYSRGDVNPRSITLLPINPLDFPAVRGAIKFLGTMYDTTSKIAQGGNIPASLMLGLEHNGLSRPLAGLGQLMQGFSTTTQGQLVSSNAGWSDLFSAANFSRILGSRPLDEAIAMDQQYRNTLYTAKDTSRIASLGSAVRTTLYDGQHPSSDQLEDFATEYAKAGGNIAKFSGKMMDWTHQSNASVANQVFSKMKTNGTIKNMQQIMGGVPLQDFLNTPSIQGSSIDTSGQEQNTTQ